MVDMITTPRPKRLSAAVFGSIVLLAGLAGCGGGSSNAAQPPPPTAAPTAAPTIGVFPTVTPIQLANGLAPTPATATIRMYIDHPFSPATLTVAPGTNITVINEGTGNGEVCNLSDPEHGLNSNDIGPGSSTHVIAPDTPGTYNYKCTYYPDTMKGTLIVSKDVTTPSSAEPVTASPTPTGAPTAGATPPASSTGGSTSGGSDTGGSTSGGGNTGGSDNGDSGGGDTISDGPGGTASSAPTFDPVKRAHNCTKPHFRETHPGICAAYPAG
jgi:plastocyanin